MDTQRRLRLCLDPLDGCAYVAREAPAVRIAEHQAVRARLLGGQQALEREVMVILETVEEVLGVEEDFFRVFLEVGHGVRDYIEVFLETDLQGLPDVEVPGLPHNREHWSL